MIALTLIVSLFVAILVGLPIAFALGVSAFAALVVWNEIPLTVMIQRMFTGIDIFPLMAVPMFILAGELIKLGRIMEGLIELGNMLVGHIRGGLAHVVVLVGMFFGGCTGSAVAESSAMGSIMISMMERSGYDRKFSTALICASSIMGPIIPPSILMVVYALAVPGVGVASLFLSGVIPGMLIAVFLMAANYMYALKRNYPKEKFQLNFGRVVKTLKETIWALLLPVVIMGGIISGAFTVTEASGMGVLYTLVITWMFSRKQLMAELPNALLRTGTTLGSILIIVAFANLFAWILATQQIPQQIATLVGKATNNAYLFLLVTNILLLVAGCFIEGAAAIFLIAPIFAPIAVKLGIDPLHFGMIFVGNLAIGLITPPMGLVLFVGCGLTGMKLEELSKEIFPFIMVLIAWLLLITYVPVVSLTLPRIFRL